MADSSVITGSAAVAAAAILTDVSGLLTAYPAVSFIGMGLTGGLAGWALAIDRGQLDHQGARFILCMLARRLMLGMCIGIAAVVWWSDVRSSQGLWMMLTGLISIDPVRGVKAVWERVLVMLPKAVK